MDLHNFIIYLCTKNTPNTTIASLNDARSNKISGICQMTVITASKKRKLIIMYLVRESLKGIREIWMKVSF